jgi:hypothetical protein
MNDEIDQVFSCIVTVNVVILSEFFQIAQFTVFVNLILLGA